MSVASRALAALLVVSILFGVIQIIGKNRSVQELRTSLSLNKKEFSSGDTLIITIHNPPNGIDIAFGQPYIIEYFHEGEWIDATWLYPGVWLTILYRIGPGESFNQSVELFPVKEGLYRVSKEIAGLNELVNLTETFRVVRGTPEDEIPKAGLPEEFWRELGNFCNNPTPEGMTVKDARVHLNEMISNAIARSDPEHKIFVAYGGGSQSVSLMVRHATKEFIERWPKECHGAKIEIDVNSWALTESPNS